MSDAFFLLALFVLIWGFAFTVLVVVRSLWDPVYCSTVGMGCVVHSAPLLQISPTVHMSEHVITSGRSYWWQRELTKFSRMVIVSDAADRLCLINPCPLTDTLKHDVGALGCVTLVIVTNCFHYMYAADYVQAYPHARFVAPVGFFHKRPELARFFQPFPRSATGTLFAGVRFFRLPDFLQEHVIYVEEASLLYAADSLIAQQPRQLNPSHSQLSYLQSLIRRLSIRARHGTVRFCDYSRQYRLQPNALADNVACWREILSLSILRVITGHGIYRGFVSVVKADLDHLMHQIEQQDTCLDLLGRRLFQACVLRCCPSYFRDWACLFQPDAHTVGYNDHAPSLETQVPSSPGGKVRPTQDRP